MFDWRQLATQNSSWNFYKLTQHNCHTEIKFINLCRSFSKAIKSNYIRFVRSLCVNVDCRSWFSVIVEIYGSQWCHVCFVGKALPLSTKCSPADKATELHWSVHKHLQQLHWGISLIQTNDFSNFIYEFNFLLGWIVGVAVNLIECEKCRVEPSTVITNYS